MNAIGTGKNFPPENPSIFDKILTYSVVVGAVVPSIFTFMNLLNQTRITGKQNIAKLKPPWILMSNHMSLLDDLFLGPLIFFPKALTGYRYIPFHSPEEQNFYRSKLIAWFMKTTKSIPVIRGRGIYQEGMNRLVQAVKRGGVLHIYPEGTRSRSGNIGGAKTGVARLVYETGAAVVPMYHQGLERVLPIGSGIPRIGRKIRVAIGEPLFFNEELSMKNEVQAWQLIISRVMNSIQEQQKILQEKWGVRPVSSHGNNKTLEKHDVKIKTGSTPT